MAGTHRRISSRTRTNGGKEEAVKIAPLQQAYGTDVELILFLCGDFDSEYLGYETAEGIDWMWEHRITDLDPLGISP